MRTSVIVSTKNRVNEVIRFTKSLFNQIELPDELIFVDSSDVPIKSNKNFINFLTEWQGKIEIRHIHSQVGLTKQRNVGIKEATGDIIYFFDDDTILKANYLQIMNKTFNDNPDYMGGMGTFIGMPEQSFKGAIVNLFRRFFLLQHDYSNGKFQISGFPRHPYGINKFMEIDVLGGCGMVYRKEIFKEFKFDENLTGYSYMEDVDFSRRVSHKYKLFYNPEAKLEHRHGSGGRGNIKDRKKMYMVNCRYLFFKNFYLRNRLFIIAHWWSILGLIIHSFIFEAKEATKGYIHGLKEFKKRKRELL